jgi:hypothetical protein
MAGALRSQMDVRISFRVRERKDTDLILGRACLPEDGTRTHSMLTCEHTTGTIRAEAQLGECPFWDKIRVRGGT